MGWWLFIIFKSALFSHGFLKYVQTVKVKVTLEQATKTQSGNSSLPLLFL